VVTRIAPSPTGYMHIGTARTALFNWLYARRHGGTYLLRVEDTDRERSTDAAVQALMEGLAWLGLEPDAEPVFQHKRAKRHEEVVQYLLERGLAYRCYMTPGELDAERQLARAEGRAVRSPWRDREAPPLSNEPSVVRFRAPLEGETVIEDLIRGPVTFRNQGIGDIVLLRSNGAPVYNLAVVVDDHDMGITHVIRGDDHLSNTPTQSLIYDAMGWVRPAFAHVPMIHGPDGAKLSKRHGAQAVGEFAEMGYLPEAMRNYLARLGWAHGDDEIFSDEQAIAWFDVQDVGRSPARLDWNKLGHVNNHYIRVADDARLASLVAHVHRERGVAIAAGGVEALQRVIPLVKEGAKTLLELADLTVFVLQGRPLELTGRTLELLNDETRGRLGRLSTRLADEFEWTPALLEAALRDFAAGEGVGLGKFGGALRGSLSGGAPAPDLASTLAALGKEEALGRLNDALSQLR
ncbi:MAG TPA: glutamate--tRNA ligase, partial [Caulobacteraceae bacterium]|nr:glutamate--tRNA ligase [Caulobacteraceae bacterium]